MRVYPEPAEGWFFVVNKSKIANMNERKPENEWLIDIVSSVALKDARRINKESRELFGKSLKEKENLKKIKRELSS